MIDSRCAVALTASLLLAAGASAPSVLAQSRTPEGEQARSSRSAMNNSLLRHHTAPRSPIGAASVENLEHAWTLETEGYVTHTPLVDARRVYVADWSGRVYAVNRETGNVLWKKKVHEPKSEWPWHGFAGTGAQSEDALFEASADGRVYALDKKTGEVLWQRRFTDDEQAGNAGTLIYYDGVVVIPVCSVEEALTKTRSDFEPNFQGHVIALDAESGEIIWNRKLATGDADGAGVWSGFAIDPSVRTLYFTTSNNYTKASRTSDALIALDLDSGEMRWMDQVYSNDLWTMADPTGPDYAFGAAPQLFLAEVDGQRRKLVAAGNKSGALYCWDASTGQRLWKIVLGYGQTGGGIMTEASIGPDAIYLWSNNSYRHGDPAKSKMDVAAVDPATGEWIWNKPEAQPAGSQTAGFLTRDVYFVPSLDGRVRGYRASDGRSVWTSGAHAAIGSSLWIEGDTMLFGSGLPKQFGGDGQIEGLIAYRLSESDGETPAARTDQR
jgi:polyvinyl alcohol dehydrogenase (cytochrome)